MAPRRGASSCPAPPPARLALADVPAPSQCTPTSLPSVRLDVRGRGPRGRRGARPFAGTGVRARLKRVPPGTGNIPVALRYNIFFRSAEPSVPPAGARPGLLSPGPPLAPSASFADSRRRVTRVCPLAAASLTAHSSRIRGACPTREGGGAGRLCCLRKWRRDKTPVDTRRPLHPDCPRLLQPDWLQSLARRAGKGAAPGFGARRCERGTCPLGLALCRIPAAPAQPRLRGAPPPALQGSSTQRCQR